MTTFDIPFVQLKRPIGLEYSNLTLFIRICSMSRFDSYPLFYLNLTLTMAPEISQTTLNNKMYINIHDSML
jgi:hypothetical protein